MPPEGNQAPEVNAAPNQQTEPGPTMSAQEYVEAVKKMKETMVPREKYDKVMSENKTLMAAVIDGKDLPEGFTQAASQGKGRTASELRKALFSGKEMTNLEYVSTALELRDKIIEEEGPEADPFAGGKRHIAQSNPRDVQRDHETADAVAEKLRECVKRAEGDPKAFNAYMSTILADDPMAMARVTANTRRNTRR